MAIPVGQPCGDLGDRVGGEVVQDHMNRQSSVHGRADQFGEPQHVATALMSRRDSAAMVAKTSELLPEP